MWSLNTGHNFTRLIDQRKAMAKHYQKLNEIKRGKSESRFTNTRFIKQKSKKKKYTKVQMDRAKQIYSDNKKIIGTLDTISQKWGELSPWNVMTDKRDLSKKTLGFKKKSNREMIKENMRYLAKIRAVKPVYDNINFDKEKKEYLRVRKNMEVCHGNFRRYTWNTINSNTNKMGKIKRQRPISARSTFHAKQKGKAVDYNDSKVILLKRPKSARPFTHSLI